MATFESKNPVTDETLANYEMTDRSEVELAIDLARDAAEKWVALGYRGRRKVLLKWNAIILKKLDQFVHIISEETGKPHSDATLEVSLSANHLAWAARHAEDILRDSHRSPGALLANMSATVERSPLGVIGVIGPWNYPIFTPMGSISYALAAGNTVVFKPSEYTPGVGMFLEETFSEIAPFSHIFKTITGLAETGQYLCESGVDKLAFTGSTATAKKVAAICAQTMTPVILECGGKDPVIVAADADLKAAADATVWSAMSNAGQSCIGAERVYVESSVAERFIEEVLHVARNLTPGIPSEGDFGPMTMPKQVKVVEGHIEDAIKRGGRLLLGDAKSVKAPFIEPVIFADVPEDSSAMIEETFGPTLVINKVESTDDAILLANSSHYGLGASVWSRRHGKKIARQLHCGMVAINTAFSFAAVASLPFGGVKDSGYGRIHGPEGLMEFTYPRAVIRPRFKVPVAFTSFKRTPSNDKLLVTLTKLLRGRLG